MADYQRVMETPARSPEDAIRQLGAERRALDAIAAASEPEPLLRDLPGPYAIGWALRAVADGYIRVRVRIPLDVLEELAIGPASPPDLRSNQAAWVSREIMQDEALEQIHAGRVGK
jgi:hypothetical protein